MQVDDLLAYQLVPSVVSAVRAAGVESLWPLQDKAVRAGALASEGAADLLVAGPSPSGKTFLLELCAVQAAHSGQRVLCVLPTAERAAAQGARLRRHYQRLGLRIGRLRVAGERGELDRAAAEPLRAVPESGSGELDVALVSAAELTQQLVLEPRLLDGVDLALIDGLEALAEPRLGPALELALLGLGRARRVPGGSQRGLRLLVSCAEVAGLPALATALRAELVVDERRPSELRSGVVHGGRLTYFSTRDDRGSGRRYEEEIYEAPRARPGATASGPTPLMRLVAELCMRGEQTLVLLPDKARAVVAVEQLTAALRSCPPAPATEALARLAQTPDGQARALLRETLSRGVALLEPGLLPSQRELVLGACRDGEVRVLCATSLSELDLELDPELRFRNVVLSERWMWRYQRRTRGYVRDELGWLDWARIGGRAARGSSSGSAAGRAMLLVPSRYDAEVALRGLAALTPQPLPLPLRAEPLEETILGLLATQAAASASELGECLAASLTGQALWTTASGAAELRTALGTALESLLTQELIRRDAAGGLQVTALGRAGAALGLPVRTVLLMQRWAEAARQVDFTALEVLLALALSPSGVEAAVPLLLSEQETSDYWSRALLRAAAEGAAERPLFRWLRAQAGVVRFEQTRALKKALLLCDWAAGRDGVALENDYQVWLGALAGAAGEFGRLVAALRQICALRGWEPARLQRLDRLAARLRQAPGEPAAERPEAAEQPPASESAAASGAVVARAVFSIRAALLAGRSVSGAPAAAAASGGGRASSGGPAVADHLVEPS